MTVYPLDTRPEVERLRTELEFYKEREHHFAALLKVCDGGAYRNDWDGALARVVEERDVAQTKVRDLLRFLVGMQWVKLSEKGKAQCPSCAAPFGKHEADCYLRKLLWENKLLDEE